MIQTTLLLFSIFSASASPIKEILQQAFHQNIQNQGATWRENLQQATQDIVNTALEAAFDSFTITRKGKLESLKAEDESLRAQLEALQKSADGIIAVLEAHNEKVQAYERLFQERKPTFEACQQALQASLDSHNQAEQNLEHAVTELQRCIQEQNSQVEHVNQLIDELKRTIDQELEPLRDRTIQRFEAERNQFASNVEAHNQGIAAFNQWQSGQAEHVQRLQEEGQYSINSLRHSLLQYIEDNQSDSYAYRDLQTIEFEIQSKQNEMEHIEAEIERAIQRIQAEIQARSQQIRQNSQYLSHEKARIEQEQKTAITAVDAKSDRLIEGRKRDIESAKAELDVRTRVIEEQYCVNLDLLKSLIDNRHLGQNSANFGNTPMGPKGEQIRALCSVSSLNLIAVRANQAQLEAIRQELENAKKGWISRERGLELQRKLEDKHRQIEDLVEKIKNTQANFELEAAKAPNESEGKKLLDEVRSFCDLLCQSLAIDLRICQTMTQAKGPTEQILAEREAILEEINRHPFQSNFEENPCFLDSIFRKCLELGPREETVFHNQDDNTFDFSQIKAVADSRKLPILLSWFSRNKGLWNHGPKVAAACRPSFTEEQGEAFQAAWSAYSTAQECALYELPQDNPAYVLSDDIRFLALLDSGEVEELYESWTPKANPESDIGNQIHATFDELKIQFSKSTTLEPQHLRQFVLAHSLIQEADRLLAAQKDADAQEWINISKSLLRTGADLLVGPYVEVAECVYGLVYGRDFDGKCLTQEDRIMQIIGLAWNRLDARIQALGRIQTAVFDFAKKKRKLKDIVITQQEIERLAKDQLIYRKIKDQNNTKIFSKTQLYIREIERVSGRKLPEQQKDDLLTKFQTSSFPELPDNMKEFHHKKFSSYKSKKLKDEWSDLYQSEWPHDGRQNYDAHHIIPKLNGGPHEGWNMFPLSQSEHSKVHGKESVLTRLQKWLASLIKYEHEN